MAKAYYELVLGGRRDFSSVPAKYQEQVKVLLEADVANGTLTEEKYNELIGA